MDEAHNNGAQAVRLVNGAANGKQGKQRICLREDHSDHSQC
jgi:hypothetical protein